MKLNLIFFIFILIVQNLFGQSKEVCNEILQKEVSLGGLNDNLEDFVSDFQTMVLCEFDSIDAQIFLGQIEYMSIITTYVLSHQLNANRENESLSFNDLKELMKEELRKPGYREVREMVVASNEIIQRVAHISEWDTHRELLIKMGMTQPQLDDIYAIVKANESSMYSEIFLIYSDTLSHRQQRELTEKARNDSVLKSQNIGLEELVTGLFAYTDYEVGLSKAREVNKPTLIYFNGYACVSARKMESNIFLNPEIQNYINSNLIFINLMVDEKANLDESEVYFSEVLDKEVKTIGQKRIELQVGTFNCNRQPLFILMESNGNEIERLGFTMEQEEFMLFLKAIEN